MKYIRRSNYNKKGYHFSQDNLFTNIISPMVYKYTYCMIISFNDSLFNNKNVIKVSMSKGYFFQLRHGKFKNMNDED